MESTTLCLLSCRRCFGHDGKHHSVSVKLKEDFSNERFILKCICHSFALVASNACKKLPSDVELLVRLVYSYMQCSFKRPTEFREIQIFLYLKPQKLLHPSQTRWLSLLSAIVRVRDQYPALILFFNREHLNPKNDENSTATTIHLLLSNPINKLYLDFSSHVLPYLTDLNKKFQSETTKIHVLYSKVSQVHKTILDCYVKRDFLNNQVLDRIQYRNPCNFFDLKDIYLEPDVAILLSKIESVLAEMNILDPPYFNGNHPPSAASLASMFPPILIGIETLDREWRLLRNDSYVDHQDSDDSFVFWNGVAKNLNSDGSLKYKVVFDLIKLIAILPHSSTDCSSIFQVTNILYIKKWLKSTIVLCTKPNPLINVTDAFNIFC